MKPDQTTREGRRGLSIRLAEKRAEAIGRSVLLPVYRLPQVPDGKAR